MPAFPSPYARLKDFSADAGNNTDNQEINDELDLLGGKLNALLEMVQVIQRADSKIANASVHPNSLDSATAALIGSSGFTVLGAWQTATVYAVGDMVEESDESYVCAVAHTSGTFSTDDAAGKWLSLTAVTVTISAYAQTLLDDANALAAQTTLELHTESELTIASGSATPTAPQHTVDTEGDVELDDLETLATAGLPAGFKVSLRANNSARSVLVKHGTGNIQTANGKDAPLTGAGSITLQLRSATWYEVYRSDPRFPKGHRRGLVLSNNVTDSQHDIDIAVGECLDSSETYNVRLATALTKSIDNAWAAGNNAGGFFSGAVASNTWYHVFLIRKNSDGSIDAGFDTSISAANKPVGYAVSRRIGSVLTDGAANIISFAQIDNLFLWKSPILDVSSQTEDDTADLRTLSVPPGVRVRALMSLFASVTSGTSVPSLYVSSPDVDDEAGAQTRGQLGLDTAGTTANSRAVQGVYGVITNTSRQVRTRASSSVTISIRTLGWTDHLES